MAKMVPKVPSADTSSNAERKLFPIFQNMPDTDDWIIFHSLAIAKHETQSQGEADFVVIVPGGGIFALEVKGGRISRRNGEWFSTDGDNVCHSIKNPISEANNAAHSIKNYIDANSFSISLKRTLTGFGVVFPDGSMHGKIGSMELADEQIADYDDCLTSNGMHNYLLGLIRFWKSRKAPIMTIPDQRQCNELVSLLRPNFEAKVSLRSIIHNIENQVVKLTDNQQDIFETIMENDRCVIKGSAGTGKTIIALNYAKEQAVSSLKTGFFCYNKQLAQYLNCHLDKNEHLVCGSFTEYMEQIVRQAGKLPTISNSATKRDTYYLQTLPQLFVEVFIEKDIPPFDCLILDEAQDLLIPSYLEAMDFILKGGIAEGRWYFFMDAEKQNLFHKENKNADIQEMLKHYHAFYTKCELKDNCRNSVAIIEKIDAFFGTQTRHRHNNERGAEVSVKLYRKIADEVEHLTSVLRLLDREGIPRNQITILSPIRFDNSAASLVTEFPISTDPSRKDSTIFYSTIHSFKGLESSVVIIIDIANLSDTDKMNILYVGMTRAKSALYLLINDKAFKCLP